MFGLAGEIYWLLGTRDSGHEKYFSIDASECRMSYCRVIAAPVFAS
jgi:hypothetical protein